MTKLQAISPLGHDRGVMGKALFESSRVRISEAPWTRVLSIRQSPINKDASALSACLKALGVVAPDKPNGFSGNAQLGCSWLEPRAWMVLSEKDLTQVPGTGLLVTDISDRLCVFKVDGEGARDLIAAGCDTQMIAVGAVARTRFGGLVNVVVQCHSEQQYRLILDVSLAHVFAGWLIQAASNQ